MPGPDEHHFGRLLLLRREFLKASAGLDLVPSEHADQGRLLRLVKLPVNELANTVLVVKLPFNDQDRTLARLTKIVYAY